MSGPSEFLFAQPHWFWLLLLLPLVALLTGRKGGAPSVLFSATPALAALASPRRASAGRFLAALQYLALALLIAAMARPQRVSAVAEKKASGIDIVLALDVSRSMLAEDFSVGSARANRLEAIKQVTKDFIEGRPNDRIAIVAFAGQPYLVSPLTLDHDWLLKNLERLRIGLVEDGTAIGSAIASSANRLKKREAKSKLIVLLTDGDNNAGKINPKTAAEAAVALGIRIYTIGAGTRGFAPFPVGRDIFGDLVYRSMKVEFNEESLQEIATLANGHYFRATDTASLVEIFKQIDQLEKTEIETRELRQVEEWYAWLAAPGLFLFVVSMLLGQTLWRRLP
jgi:Ca-activated chloride channel family protein